MAIHLTQNYDIIKVVDIPESDISEKLVIYMEYHKRYLDAHASEHMYNASQIMEEADCEPALKKELEIIDELCQINGAVYFRIIKE